MGVIKQNRAWEIFLIMTIVFVVVWLLRWDSVDVHKNGILLRYKTDKWTGIKIVQTFIDGTFEETVLDVPWEEFKKEQWNQEKRLGTQELIKKRTVAREKIQSIISDWEKKNNKKYEDLDFFEQMRGPDQLKITYVDEVNNINEQIGLIKTNAEDLAKKVFVDRAKRKISNVTYIWLFLVGLCSIITATLFIKSGKQENIQLTN